MFSLKPVLLKPFLSSSSTRSRIWEALGLSGLCLKARQIVPSDRIKADYVAGIDLFTVASCKVPDAAVTLKGTLRIQCGVIGTNKAFHQQLSVFRIMVNIFARTLVGSA